MNSPSKIGDFAADNGWFQGAGQNLAHGALQGGLTEATGGEFRHGFYAGFASSALAGPVSGLAPGGTTGQTVAAAVVGGTASAIGGGKFANGAVSGAFTYMFNHAAHDNGRSGYSFSDGLKDATSGALQGAAAFVDGIIPFGDPLENSLHLYDSNQDGLSYSRKIGEYTRDVEMTVAPGAVGLNAGAKSVLYAGGDAAEAAAFASGRVTLAQTPIGALANRIGFKSDFIWRNLSRVYAANARGAVPVYWGSAVRTNAIIKSELGVMNFLKNATPYNVFVP